MKAEHRKELQTNALADRMGRMVQRMKAPPNRRSVLWILLAVAAVIVFIGLTFYWNNQRTITSQLWVELDESRLFYPTRDHKLARGDLLGEQKDSKAGIAARFQLAWTILWDRGIKVLAANPKAALDNIDNAEASFAQLAEECKDDPVWGPEALYALATIEETRAVKDRDYLDKAVTRYKAVSSKFKDSAAGQAAAARAKYLEENRPIVSEFYASFQQNVAPFGLGPMELPPDLQQKLKEKLKK
jgi:hypothetical protein